MTVEDLQRATELADEIKKLRALDTAIADGKEVSVTIDLTSDDILLINDRVSLGKFNSESLATLIKDKISGHLTALETEFTAL